MTRPPSDHSGLQGLQGLQEDEQELDPDFADFLNDVVAAQEQGAATPRPEFGEVLRRAQGLDPTAVSEAMLDQARALASVVPLSARRDPPAELPDPALDGFLRDVQAHNETVATERRLGGIPALAIAARPAQRAPQVAALVALAAALVLLFVGTPSLFSSEVRTQASSPGLMPWTLDRSSEASSRTHTHLLLDPTSRCRRQLGSCARRCRRDRRSRRGRSEHGLRGSRERAGVGRGEPQGGRAPPQATQERSSSALDRGARRGAQKARRGGSTGLASRSAR